ncbi:hypothetical protein AB1N83_013120 [Pleurotus pulmonarius]
MASSNAPSPRPSALSSNAFAHKMAVHSKPQRASLCRPVFPNEIFLAIVNELADDRKTLLVLLLVSPSLNHFALGHIYREISLCPNSPPFQDGVRFRKLLRDIEANPRLRLVKSFAFKIIPSFTYKKDYTDVERILPLLVNVRRLCLEFSPPEGVDYAILPLIPPSVDLTSLILHHELCHPGDFPQLLQRHPRLKSIAITRGDPLANMAILPGSFPNLRALQLTVEDILRINALPSLRDLSIQGNSDGAARHIVKAFPALRTLSWSLSPASTATSLSVLASGLPGLEYLSCHIDVWDIMLISNDYMRGISSLASSRLKYLKLYTFDHPPEYDDIRFVFDSVKSMVILDVFLELEELRFSRDFAQPSVLAPRREEVWEKWWEQVEEDVEQAVLKHKSSPTAMTLAS